MVEAVKYQERNTQNINLNSAFGLTDTEIQERLLRAKVSLQKKALDFDLEQDLNQAPDYVQDILEGAYALHALPVRERPRAVVDLLRSRVDYSYPNVLSDLEKRDSGLVDEICRNNRNPTIGVKSLQETVRLGLGNCNSLSISTLVLGRVAGLEGAFLTNGAYMGNKKGIDPNPIRNILRCDTGQKLFRDYPLNNNIPDGHGWVEFKMGAGEWMPVDAATQLIGDNEKELDMFREANYRSAIWMSVYSPYLQKEVEHNGLRDLEFLSGEDTHSGVIEIHSSGGLMQHDAFSTRPMLSIELHKDLFGPNIALGVDFDITSISI